MRISKEQFERAAHDAAVALIKGDDDADKLVLEYLRLRPSYDGKSSEFVTLVEKLCDALEVWL